jgi:uncharacterized protein
VSHLLAGFALGVAVNAHCAAMCGPLVLVAQARSRTPGASARGWQMWTRLLPYHGGRAVTYVLLGMLAGTAGSGLSSAGIGPIVSVMAGLLLISHATGLSARVPSPAWTRASGAAFLWIAGAARRRGVRTPVMHGALHGLLPCGTLYLAIAAAGALGDIMAAGTFMAGFAAGTMPILVIIAACGPAIAARLPGAVVRAAPVAVALVGLLLVARGLDVAHPGHVADSIRPTSHASHGR